MATQAATHYAPQAPYVDEQGFPPYNPADFETPQRQYSGYLQQTGYANTTSQEQFSRDQSSYAPYPAERSLPYPQQGGPVRMPSPEAAPVMPPRPLHVEKESSAYNPRDYFAQTRYHDVHKTDSPEPHELPSLCRTNEMSAEDSFNSQGAGHTPGPYFPPPPQRVQKRTPEYDVSSPIHYVRDPHRLVAYLVPLPKPKLAAGQRPEDIPARFLLYTPPPPPLSTPKEGEKEAKVHKLQRKWESEVRQAKTTDAKITTWKGAKGKATKGISWAMSQTKSSNIEFLNRIGGGQEPPKDAQAPTGTASPKPVKLEEMLLVYPTSMGEDTDKLREEFVNTMLRTKSKAQRDAIIATGLLPVSFAVDVMATLIWPFGGLLEIDSVWLYSSVRGAKTSRSITKRLTPSSSATAASNSEEKLALNFTPSPRLDVLERYLAARCHERNPQEFPSAGVPPTETEVLEAIGWSPAGETQNWEDEQWEITEVKDDLKAVMKKGAKEWDKWCQKLQEDPEKALAR